MSISVNILHNGHLALLIASLIKLDIITQFIHGSFIYSLRPPVYEDDFYSLYIIATVRY